MHDTAADASRRLTRAADSSDATATFEAQRATLLGVAYRVLGTWTDAEDTVQDAWLRWSKVDLHKVENPRGFLLRTATRLAIDRLRRRQARREAYTGEWLPEPVLRQPDAQDRAELNESLSTAVLVILERLTPLERAVYVLREAYGYTYAEVAETVGRREAAVRQLARRARQHVAERHTRFRVEPETERAVTERFLAASASGDLEGLLDVLAPEVRLVADGGGKVRAPLLPVIGAEKVARFFMAAVGRQPASVSARVEAVNAGSGVVVREAGHPITAVTFDVAEDRLQTIYLVANPDKLHQLT